MPKDQFIGNEFFPVYVSFNYYPFGAPIYLFRGAFNEFYSVTRWDNRINQAVKFYWNVDNPPPFFQFPSHEVFSLLQNGEVITWYRFIGNSGSAFGETDAAGKSITKSKRIVTEIKNGMIVNVQEENEIDTKRIEPGQFVLVQDTFTYKIQGFYQFNFELDSKNQVAERKEDNNLYEERESDNLGSGQ